MRAALARTIMSGLASALAITCTSGSQRPHVHYQVKLRDGGAVEVSIRYTLPSGEERRAHGTTPWTSPEFTFGPDSTLSIRAETSVSVDSPLLCNLVGSKAEGAWTLSTINEPAETCGVSYKLGQWPPDDNSGPLIRVG
jgi:hypothetical protein